MIERRYQVRGRGPLALLRIEMGLTQKQAAALAGISHQYLRRLEAGLASPTITVVGQMSKGWNVADGAIISAVRRCIAAASEASQLGA